MENRYKMFLTTLKKGSGFLWFFFVENKTLVSSHLEAGGGGGVTPRTYAGIRQHLLTTVANFKSGMGGLDCFCTFVARSPGKDSGDSFYRRHIEMEQEKLL